MFIPERCPRCRAKDEWREVRSIFSGIRIFGGLRIGGATRGLRERPIRYRCAKCGFEAEYTDRAETLGRSR